MDEKQKEILGKIYDAIRHETWKLQGLTAMFQVDGSSDLMLSEAQANGLFFILDDIVDKLLENTDAIHKMR